MSWRFSLILQFTSYRSCHLVVWPLLDLNELGMWKMESRPLNWRLGKGFESNNDEDVTSV